MDRQKDRQTDKGTDGQTDRQTEFSSLERVCILCSLVKKELSAVHKLFHDNNKVYSVIIRLLESLFAVHVFHLHTSSLHVYHSVGLRDSSLSFTAEKNIRKSPSFQYFSNS